MLVEKHGDIDALGAAFQHKIASEPQRPAAFENVIDQEDVTAFDIAVDVLDDFDALAGRPLAVARQGDELDFRRQSRMVDGANQIGGENE